MKVKIDDKLFPIPEDGVASGVPMGVLRVVKREYGLIPGKDDLDLMDPDHASAYMFLALYRDAPRTPSQTLIEQVDRVTRLDFVNDDGTVLTEAQTEAEQDPTPPPSGGAKDSKTKSVAAGK